MIGARVNGKLVTIDYVIQNGDRIEIITSQNSQRAEPRLAEDRQELPRQKIRSTQWFKQELKEDNIVKGKETLANYCKAKGIVLQDILKPEYIERGADKVRIPRLEFYIGGARTRRVEGRTGRKQAARGL